MAPHRHIFRRFSGRGPAICLLAAIGCAAWAPAAAGAASVSTSGPATRENLQQRIAEAIRQLGGARYHLREKAMQFLWSVGRPAEPALREALNSGDPEVVRRARHILDKFSYGIYPDTPKEVVELVDQYRQADVSAKRAILGKLLEMGPKAHPVLFALCASRDEAIRQEINRLLQPHARKIVPTLLAAGRRAEAGALLELGAASLADSAIRNHAAYLLLQGGLDEKIRQLETELPVTKHAAKRLAYYYRAKGDLGKAREAARESGDQPLLDAILFELGEWKTLAEINAQTARRDKPGELGLLAAYSRLAGNGDVFEKALADIEKLPAAPQGALHVRSRAEALLVNDRPKVAIDLLVEAGQYRPGFELLCAQLRLGEALRLVEKARAAKAKGLFWLELDLVRVLAGLGKKDQASGVVARLHDAAKSEPSRLPAVIETEHSLGMTQQAFAHAAEALEALGKDASPASLLGAVFPEQRMQAVVWWKAMRRRSPKQSHQASLERLRELLGGQAAEKDLQDLASHAQAAAAELPRNLESSWLAAIAETFHAAGQNEPALAYLDKAGEVSRSGAPWTRAGDLLANRQLWPRAAEQYTKASQKDPRSPIPLYLQGWALCQAGSKQQGEELMQLGGLICLADDGARQSLAGVLAERGLSEAADRQLRLMKRIGELPYHYMGWQWLRCVSREALAEKDYVRAAEQYERYRLRCLDPSAGLIKLEGHLILAVRIHLLRARACLAAGQVEQALAQADVCLAALPGSVDVALELVPALEKLGRRQEAEGLFSKVFTFLEGLCEEYPDAAAHHNNAAWLAARCRRRLDRAVQYAAKAVELSPKNPAFVDTLAEAHFQSGRRERAVELMRRCVELDPKNEYFAKQLKRFQSGRPASETDPPEPG